MTSSILHHNEDWSIILVDIPTSICEAQGFNDTSRLLSGPELSKPFESSEPKSERAKLKVNNYARVQYWHQDIAALATDALKSLKIALGPAEGFCGYREIASDGIKRIKKRKVVSHGHGEECHLIEDQNIDGGSSAKLPEFWDSSRKVHVYDDGDDSEPFDGSYFNVKDEEARLCLSIDAKHRMYDFRIPPHSYCLLSKCEDVAIFRNAAKEYSSEEQLGVGRFSVIVMDPPWPNHSATRKGNYKCAWSKHTILDMLLSMDLDVHIGPGGFVAVWTTNRPEVRRIVLDELFPAWGVELTEEWIYLKITSNGEPVTPIEGVWRKPYEVLLIGKAPANRYAPVPVDNEDEVRRRVIAAVPDLHSRKPCLKNLVETLLLHDATADFKVLEIFARHLVRGWMSWGDEVLKYNALGHWTRLGE